MREIQHIRSPYPAGDDPIFNPRNLVNQDVPANIASNKPRKRFALTKFSFSKAALDSLKHVLHAICQPIA
jgi:hypothetical protein